MKLTASSVKVKASTELKKDYLKIEKECNDCTPPKNSIKISVITVAYNSGSTIADTLISVKNQSYSNIEHIVKDGKSCDQTASIIKSFPHVSKFISEKDNGIYDAINKGLQVATGDVIGILHSDDIYSDDHVIQKVANYFE